MNSMVESQIFVCQWSCRIVTDLELKGTLIIMPKELFRGERPELEARLYEESNKAAEQVANE